MQTESNWQESRRRNRIYLYILPAHFGACLLGVFPPLSGRTTLVWDLDRNFCGFHRILWDFLPDLRISDFLLFFGNFFDCPDFSGFLDHRILPGFPRISSGFRIYFPADFTRFTGFAGPWGPSDYDFFFLLVLKKKPRFLLGPRKLFPKRQVKILQIWGPILTKHYFITIY